MQRHAVLRYAGGREAVHKLRREVKTRGRCGNGAVLTRKHRLVVAPVVSVLRPPTGDVGRQRHVPDRRDAFVEDRTGQVEAQHDFTGLSLFLHGRIEARHQAGIVVDLAEANAVSGLKTLARPRQRLPARGIDATDERRRDLGDRARPRPLTAELSRDYLGIIDDQRVAWAEQVRQIAYM